eukprot:gnl/MRDRNA2_/MRDRNA2_64045_c0_seq1.p1 gnl/MRDRNA2_/MRDRNA2_64045_c0~~gnl/MRDRNA2_/MRDRNA2_64045_c0_seq1.p1  ORF type:complete len:516 (-),score=107.38 gnl/MRDRNA2_/MRDRNA2_64045_c0_seq1:8-1555(-)
MVGTLRRGAPAHWQAAGQVSLGDNHSPCYWASWQAKDVYTGKVLQRSSASHEGAVMQKSVGSRSQSLIGQDACNKAGRERKLSLTGNRGTDTGKQGRSEGTVHTHGSEPRPVSAPLKRSPKALSPLMLAEKRAEELKKALYTSWAEKRENEERLQKQVKKRQTLEGMLAAIVCERFQGAEAEEWLRSSLTKNQDLDSNLRSQLHAELAKLIVRHGGDPSAARTELLTAINHDPGNLCARIALCYLFEGPLEMKSTAEKYWLDLEKALVGADKDAPAAKYMLVDVAEFHERFGRFDEAQRLYAKAKSEPWASRDNRVQNVSRDWNFVSEPSVPPDATRVQGSVSVADMDLSFHRPLKAPCNCKRCLERVPEDTRKSLMVAQNLQDTPSKGAKKSTELQDFLAQMKTNSRRLRKSSLAEAVAFGKDFGPLPAVKDSDSENSGDEHPHSNLPLAPHVIREVCQMGFCTSLYGLARDSWTTAEETRSWVKQAEGVARRCCVGRRFHVNVVDVEEASEDL